MAPSSEPGVCGRVGRGSARALRPPRERERRGPQPGPAGQAGRLHQRRHLPGGAHLRAARAAHVPGGQGPHNGQAEAQGPGGPRQVEPAGPRARRRDAEGPRVPRHADVAELRAAPLQGGRRPGRSGLPQPGPAGGAAQVRRGRRQKPHIHRHIQGDAAGDGLRPFGGAHREAGQALLVVAPTRRANGRPAKPCSCQALLVAAPCTCIARQSPGPARGSQRNTSSKGGRRGPSRGGPSRVGPDLWKARACRYSWSPVCHADPQSAAGPCSS
mmetsp:Transcript_12326/g.26440  ORF Transcript_12326/g.26440 Transcript_12326/m.26440 type:complete len:271 (+) Transcript_12326:1463-2275(+)